MSEQKHKKAQVTENMCVACGCCIKVCPLEAIQIYKGLYAMVDESKCVGCGRCKKECPASIIVVKEVANEETK